MTVFRRGEVVLVAFPFTDLATTKMRPALVVSSDAFNNQHLDVVLAAITSQVPKKIAAAEHLLSVEDQKQAGLPKLSIVKLSKLVTIDQRLIRKRLGRVLDPTLSLLTLKLHKEGWGLTRGG